MRYPIGIQSFEKIREGGFVYVDKTDMVYSLANEGGNIYFLSRPRRFGKSLLISTLKSYFEGRKELFHGLAIDRLETDWLRYPVLHLSFGGQNFLEPYTLDKVLDEFVATAESIYGKGQFAQTLGSRFKAVLGNAHKQTGRRAVVLIDEYDKPLLDVMEAEVSIASDYGKVSLEDYNLNLLKGFYSVFKEADADLQFVFLTGVTKFSQVSVFSGFNQPKDITMTAQYETICGISEREMEEYFHQQIIDMADENGFSFDEMKSQLKKQYDGYHFSKRMTGVYNPFSLLNALQEKDIQSYWFRTGTPTYLIRLMEHFNETLDEFTGKYYSIQDFSDYKADIERPLPMIYQSGYLTIKDYDPDVQEFLLDIPNNEVRQGLISLLANNYFKTKDSADSCIRLLVKSLKRGDLDEFRKSLTSFLASIPYSMRRKENERERERYFHYTFYLILRLLSTYLIYTEKQLSQGRANCIIETDNFIYIFEFKLNGTADEALQQIESRGYALPYANDPRKLHKIGCSFSSESGTIKEWKEKML